MTGHGWLPDWLAWVGVLAFGTVLAVHAGHAATGHAGRRVWHCGHVLMAAGMVVMYLPSSRMVVPPGVGIAVYAAAAAAVGSGAVIVGIRRGRPGVLMAVAAVDLAAMAAMFAMTPGWAVWPSVLAAAWFGVQAAGWTNGVLVRVLLGAGLSATAPMPALRHSGVAGRGDDPATPVEPGSVEPGSVEPGSVESGSVESGSVAPAPGGAHEVSLRTTLTVMAVGMAYMFLAMRFGM